MATRQANIIINVDDKSLTQLNDEIQLLNSEIDQLTVGTEEWVKANKKLGDLKRDFNKVTKEAEKLQGQIEKISGPQQLQAFSKLGAGMVGAFAGVSGTIELLGIQNEEFDKMTAKATTLMSIMGGLNQVAETFSAENIKGLKGIGKGFTNMTRSVKTASKAMKAALITTGIGALVIALGLIVANWDKIKDAVSGARRAQKKAFEESKRQGEETLVGLGEIRSALEENIKLKEQFDEYNVDPNSSFAIVLGQYALAQVRIRTMNEELKTQIKLKSEIIELGGKEIAGSNTQIEVLEKKVDKEKISLKHNLEMQGVNAGATKKSREKLQVAEANLAIAMRHQAAMKIEIENLSQQLELNYRILNLRTELAVLREQEVKDSELNIRNNENQIKVLEAYGTKQSEIYVKQKENIQDQIDLIEDLEELGTAEVKRRKANLQAIYDFQIKRTDLTKEEAIERNKIVTQLTEELRVMFALTDEEVKRLAELKSQKEALRVAEVERRRILKLQIQSLEVERELAEMVSTADEALLDRLYNLYEEQDITEDKIKSAEDHIALVKEENDKYEELLRKKEQISNFDKNGLGFIYTQNEELEKQLRSYNDLFGVSAQILEGQVEHVKISEREDKFGETILDKAAKQLTFFTRIKEAERERLEIEREVLVTQEKILKANLKRAESKRDELGYQVEENALLLKQAQTRLDAAKNDVERAQRLAEVIALETEADALVISQKENKQEIADTQTELVRNSEDILSIEQDIQQTTEDTLEFQKQLTDEIENQSRAYAKLQGFLADYAAEIQATLDVMNSGFELIAAAADRRAAVAQQNILNLQQELDELEGDIDDTEQRRLDILAELEDANGEYYNDLLEELQKIEDKEIESQDNVQAKREEIDKEIAIQEKKKAQAEHDAAAWRKAQAIIDGIIQTALGVIKALPNVFLSVATGVLGAAGVATIATQKLPPNPNKGEGFEGGGFTGLGRDTEPAGVVHRNEYVVPARVVNSPSAKTHIAALENKRMKGYALGGPVTQGADMSMDYEKFAEVIVRAVSAQPPQQVSLVAVSNGLNEVNYTKQQSGLSR